MSVCESFFEKVFTGTVIVELVITETVFIDKLSNILYNICNNRRKNMAEIICAVYKIINTITGDFYIGSSKNVKKRWAEHKCL